jgi:hypothetical protein
VLQPCHLHLPTRRHPVLSSPRWRCGRGRHSPTR